MGSLPGGGELIIVLLVLLLLFGASRLPKLARSMGQAGKEFKSGLKGLPGRRGRGAVPVL
ncbi:MAG: twin-arginine translocase TatA/TatE family subunit [Actinobacteria bacterium]|nr:twin-arginine translocase TatA/TatE family subunit [Actinomycetota bacterium]